MPAGTDICRAYCAKNCLKTVFPTASRQFFHFLCRAALMLYYIFFFNAFLLFAYQMITPT